MRSDVDNYVKFQLRVFCRKSTTGYFQMRRNAQSRPVFDLGPIQSSERMANTETKEETSALPFGKQTVFNQCLNV